MLGGNGQYLPPKFRHLTWMTHNRRLFLVDGIISLPIALAGFLFIPDVPETSRAFYLNKDVRESFQQSKSSIEA